DLADAFGLLMRGRGDFSHDRGYCFYRTHHVFHDVARVAGLASTRRHLLKRLVDQLLDFLGSLCTTLCQRADLARHDGEALALLPCAGRFDRGIQRQDVGLERDTVDHADNLRHATGAVRDLTHGIQDRKSTRLNSSHVKISYAVFCLKKKKSRIPDSRTYR